MKNKFSELIKSIERWLMDSLKCERRNHKVSHCNDITQTIDKIYSISRRKICNLNKDLIPALSLGKKFSFDFDLFSQDITTTPNTRYDIDRMEKITRLCCYDYEHTL